MNTKALRQKVLDLAIHGKLVPQNPNDESATVLLEKIRVEKAEKIKKGELKADKKDSFIFVGSDKRHYEQFADGTVKDIEDEIPFDLPKNWAWTKAKCIYNIRSAIRIHQTDWQTSGIPFFRGRELVELCKTGNVNPEIFISEELYEQNKEKGGVPQKNDLLVSAVGTLGYVHIVEGTRKFYYKDAYILCFENHFKLNPKYTKLVIESDYTQKVIYGGSKGTTVDQLTIENAKDLFIPFPPAEEQERIVSALENALEQINFMEQNKSDLQSVIKQTKSKILDLAIHGKLVPQDPTDEPAEELLKRIATSDNRPYKKFDKDDSPYTLPTNWAWCYLGDLCKISSAKRVLQQDWKDSGIPFYRAREIAQLSNNEKVKDDLFITPELYNELKSKYGVPSFGDLMISAVGTIGKIYIVKETDCFYYKDASVICFSKKEKNINSKFLKLCLESSFLQNQIYSQSTGTTVDTITINKAQEYLFPLPSIKEQSRIVSKIEELFSYLDNITLNLV